jgi:hypothetical protein
MRPRACLPGHHQNIIHGTASNALDANKQSCTRCVRSSSILSVGAPSLLHAPRFASLQHGMHEAKMNEEHCVARSTCRAPTPKSSRSVASIAPWGRGQAELQRTPYRPPLASQSALRSPAAAPGGFTCIELACFWLWLYSYWRNYFQLRSKVSIYDTVLYSLYAGLRFKIRHTTKPDEIRMET